MTSRRLPTGSPGGGRIRDMATRAAAAGLATLLLSALVPVSALAQAGRIPLSDPVGGITIPWWTSASGGVIDDSKGGTIHATVGLPAIGTTSFVDDITGDVTTLRLGYWLPVPSGPSGVRASQNGASALARSWPNPFSTSTTLSLSMRQAGSVRIAINNVRGEQVTTLVDGASFAAGTHAIIWNATDGTGSPVPSGTYFCRIEVRHESGAPETSLLILHLKK